MGKPMKGIRFLKLPLYVVTLGLLALAQTGCGDDDPKENTPGNQEITCDNSGDCPAAQPECNAGICESPAGIEGCTEHEHCPDGQVCDVNGKCQPEASNDLCTNHKDCPGDEVCNDKGTCDIPTTGVGCTTTDDCTGFDQCVDGSCKNVVQACATNPCQNGGECVDSGNGLVYCDCPTGFTGGLCQNQVSACALNPCANGGQCDDIGAGQFVCDCPFGFEGDTCVQQVNACRDEPCLNGGTCGKTGPGTFSCECPTFFGGDTCEDEVSGCEDLPCKNGGICEDGAGPGEYSCECPPEYEGNTCGTPVDLCAKGDYECGSGSCVYEGPGEYSCDCDPGWSGDSCDSATSCVLRYEIDSKMRIRDTALGAGDQEQPRDSQVHPTGEHPHPGFLKGQLYLRIQLDDDMEISDQSAVEVMYYDLHQNFYATTGARIGTNVWAYSPAKGEIDNPNPLATGSLQQSGNETHLSFPDCTLPANYDKNKDAYTPAVVAQGPGCLSGYRSEGVIHCDNFCGSGNMDKGYNYPDDTWNQPLADMILSANFQTLSFDPTWVNPQESKKAKEQEVGWLEIPNTSPGRTWMLWEGTLDEDQSTCQFF